MDPVGLIIAASHSGAGKTTLTLGLLRALKQKGIPVAPAKAGPDYIDPAFHAAASDTSSITLDPWAMAEDTLRGLASSHARKNGMLFVEGVMGLFDGTTGGAGSTANLARTLNLPVVLVLDVKGQAQTAAAVANGLRYHHRDIDIIGVLLNRVGSDRHAALLTEAFNAIELPILGIVRNNPALKLPSRHLGLVQAAELEDLDQRLDDIASHVASEIDLDRLINRARPLHQEHQPPQLLPAPGKHIAIARDIAFSFIYPHLLDGWRRDGARISFFSPLANNPPHEQADAIYLPGGYPELHAAKLASNTTFKKAMIAARDAGTFIYGECGGYMTLGEKLTDASGKKHRMLGLLPLETSFQNRKLHLGYRLLTPNGSLPWVKQIHGHEFHYASTVHTGNAEALFEAHSADGRALGSMGLRRGSVMGSFAHVIA